MKNITLHTNSKQTTTSVPNAFIDDFMADANGEFVKIYLYLLRCLSQPEDFSISKMADKFEHTEKDITRALRYWEKLNILRLEYDPDRRLSGICMLDSVAPSIEEDDSDFNEMSDYNDTSDYADRSEYADMPDYAGRAEYEFSQSVPLRTAPTPVVAVPAPAVVIPTPAPVAVEPAVMEPKAAERPEYTRDELMSFQQEEDVQDLMFIAEKYLGRTLNPTDINAILYWHDSLRFSVDLIEYLIEYCVDKGHLSIRYMDKVAIGWAGSNITTVEQAKKAASMHSQSYYGVMKAFGISGRNLVDFELEFIDKWTNRYGFTIEIISEACKRTLQAIHQPSFEYADTILTNWNKNQVHKTEDIAVLDLAFQKTKAAKSIPAARTTTPKGTAAKNRFTNYPQRSYDYAELEKQLLNNSMQS